MQKNQYIAYFSLLVFEELEMVFNIHSSHSTLNFLLSVLASMF